MVWCALLSDEVGSLCKEAVEDGPASITALVHVVALHHILRGQLLDFFFLVSVLQLESSFDSLDEALSVAGATRSLVSEWTCEIVATYVSEVPVFGDGFIRDFLWVLVLLLPRLSFDVGLFKLRSVLSEFALARAWVLGKGLLFIWRIALAQMRLFLDQGLLLTAFLMVVQLMAGLKHADIGLPGT